MSAAARHLRPVRSELEVSADGPPPDHRGGTDRPVRATPQRDATRVAGTPASTVDRSVKTHCCFCGQQCGIKLKVNDNEVVGFEPWYEFPFNEGKLCPKGVKRYLQGTHPDRLLATARARRSGDAGRVPRRSPGTQALDRVVAEIHRIQADLRPRRVRHAVRRVADQREELPDGQVRPPRRLHTANLDYNGRLCMVSAGVGEQEGARHRPGAEPVERHPARRRRLDRRDEHRRVLPITTSYIWRARDRGAQLIVADPRVDAARPHRRPVPAGPAGHATRRCSAPSCTC